MCKKVLFIIALITLLNMGNRINAKDNYCAVNNIEILDPNILYVEYVCIDSRFYKITHYTDNTTGVEPVLGQLEDLYK